jgi:hypothetical protein
MKGVPNGRTLVGCAKLTVEANAVST